MKTGMNGKEDVWEKSQNIFLYLKEFSQHK